MDNGARFSARKQRRKLLPARTGGTTGASCEVTNSDGPRRKKEQPRSRLEIASRVISDLFDDTGFLFSDARWNPTIQRTKGARPDCNLVASTGGVRGLGIGAGYMSISRRRCR